MRRTLLGITIVLVGTGCTAPPSVDPANVAAPIEMLSSPSPFTQVRAGAVTAIVPDGWDAHAPAGSSFRGGFLASPHPARWNRMDGRVAGMTATWVDATRMGIPSDFYYLAAAGPLLSGLTHSSRCNAESRRVFVDRRPTFSGGAPTPGDFVARGEGTCLVGGVSTRWAYFVAAPGYGPVRELGIAASGLYVVVAVTPENERAPSLLDRLIRNTSFGGSSVHDLVEATSAVRAQ